MTWVSSYFLVTSSLPHYKITITFSVTTLGVVGIQEVMYVLYLMVGWLKSIEYLGLRCMKSLHRSLSYNGASLSHKNGEFYFVFKLGISGLLHKVLAIADFFIRVDKIVIRL